MTAPPLSFAEQLALLGAPLDIPDGSFAAGVISPEGGDTDDVLTISGGVAIWASIAAVAVSATLAFSDLSGSIANSQVPASAVTQHEAALTILSSQVDMSKVGTPAFTTVQHVQDVFHSSGWVSGGVLSNDGSANIDVTSGEGLLRATDSRTVALLFADWSASDTNAISDGTAKFVGVEYNAGIPQVVVKASDTWDFNTDFPVGSVVREGSILHISQAEHAVGDHANFMIQRLYEVQKFARDNITGGLILGEDGANRYVTVSAGTIWERLNQFAISAIDTDPGGGADDFQTYKHVSGTFTLTTGVTAWPNTQYDDGTDLVTMDNNKYANLWFYLEPDGDLVMLYGTAQYTKSSLAELESPPSTVPLRISTHAFLAARLIFQKSASSAEEINSVFTTVFSPTLVSDHGNLAGLTDDDHAQYILEDGTRAFSGNISHGGNDITSVGTITATTFSGALSGNASTATALETARDINGVSFNGTASITVTADANTLTNTTLKSTVVTSSLTSLGTITSLLATVGGIGIARTDGTLHVHTATAGAVAADVNADDLVVENSTHTGISVLAPDNRQAAVYFGSPSDPIGCQFAWVHDDLLFFVGTHRTNAALTFTSGAGLRRWGIDSSGHFIAEAVDSYDIGDGTNDPRNLFLSGAATIDGNVLIGGAAAATGSPQLDVLGGPNYGQLFLRRLAGDNTQRVGIVFGQSLAAEEGFSAILAFADTNNNQLFIGGADSAHNAATEINFYTAADATTLTGTIAASITGVGTASILRLRGDLTIDKDINHDGDKAGFYGTAPITIQTVAATAGALQTALVNLGLIVAA